MNCRKRGVSSACAVELRPFRLLLPLFRSLFLRHFSYLLSRFRSVYRFVSGQFDKFIICPASLHATCGKRGHASSPCILCPMRDRPAGRAHQHHVRDRDRAFLLGDAALDVLAAGFGRTCFFTIITCSTRTLPSSGNTRSTRPFFAFVAPADHLHRDRCGGYRLLCALLLFCHSAVSIH